MKFVMQVAIVVLFGLVAFLEAAHVKDIGIY